MEEHVTIESLLIGDYKILQDDRFYRFTSDSVVLSRFLKANKGETVADICSGCGIVGIHFLALNEPFVKEVGFFEIQPRLADLCEKSLEINKMDDKCYVVKGKLQENSENYKNRYSLILCNPPYKKKDSGEQNLKREIAICRHEVEITQSEIAFSAYKMLKHGGRLRICQRTERLPELFSDLEKAGLNPCALQFVVAKNSQKPYLALVEAVKGVKRPFKVLPNYEN